MSHQPLEEGKDHLPQCAGRALPKAARDMLVAFVARVHWWLVFKLLSTRSLRKAAFQVVGPKPVHGVVPPQVQELY